MISGLGRMTLDELYTERKRCMKWLLDPGNRFGERGYSKAAEDKMTETVSAIDETVQSHPVYVCRERIARPLRALVRAMFERLDGAYGSGESYCGEFEEEIRSLSDALNALVEGKDDK